MKSVRPYLMLLSLLACVGLAAQSLPLGGIPVGSTPVITVGNNTNSGLITSGTSFSWSHNNNGDTVRVCVGNWNNSTSTTTVTFDGVSMPLIYKSPTTASGHTAQEYVLAVGGAHTGSKTVAVSSTGSFLIAVGGATSYSGVNQSTPTRGTAFSTSSNANNNPSLPAGSITQVSGDLIVGCAYNYDTSQTKAASPQVDELALTSVDTVFAYSMGNIPSTGSQGLSWTGSGSSGATQWVAGAYALIP